MCWVIVIIDVKIKWLNLTHTDFKALRAGRIMNVEVTYSVSLIFLTGSTSLRKKASPRQAGSTG
jgi:hypothetical protein